ncbi:MAG: hypothetical protein LQ346_005193 [Caloplaca aetnensis]|nr:MAG: hypothetical protein LQ346_005193 [Caloplaca aetnensis]
MLKSFIAVLSIWSSAILAAPPWLGLQFEKRAGELPTLTLPYATYRAARYNPNGDLYVFKNIRFAAPPVGNLRWAKPAPPPQQSGVQDGSYGPICVQAPLPGLQLTGPGADSPIGEAFNKYLGGIPVPSFKEASEDCLFLDVYVPAKAVENPSLRLPVISWFYGGAYTFGAKDQVEPVLPLYDGTGLLQQSGGNVIFVVSNYRVGAYGFLAGNTMEKEGLPNAGLYDQRAALQWIQDYIGLLGGDKTQVSAWGQSAGAGSIMHQLVAFGGTQDPLFSRAVLQSPGFSLLFDRKGKLEQAFERFASLAGCSGQGVSCLRAASAETLDKANTALNTQGDFTLGPSADGNMIRQLATLELASGHYTRLPTSLILSHVTNEAEIFTPPSVLTDAQFTAFITASFAPSSGGDGVIAAIEARYPPVLAPGSNYTTQRARLRDLIQEASFVCNVRTLSDAYAGKTYNLQYSVTPALHATDLLPTFYNLNLDLGLLGDAVSVPLLPGFGGFSQAYQSYLVSHARTGDPNTYRKIIGVPPAIRWPMPGMLAGGDALTGVLDAGDLGFTLVEDAQTRKSRCGFWRDVAAAVTSLGGYAPPGSVVGTGLVPVTGDPSRNYGTV